MIAAHNRRARNLVDHRQVVGEHLDAQVRTSRANSLYAPGTEMIGIATQATLLAVGGAMTASGRITVGEMAAFLLFLASFFAPIQTLVQLYNSYQQGGAAIVKLRSCSAPSPATPQAVDATELPPIEGAIELDQVTFAYEPGRPVLHDVDLRIEPGETVAFVGETGSGKSTIARLLTRFHDPDSGAVRIDGHDLRQVTIGSLRRQLGVVPQEPFLFAGLVRDNVAFARPDATDEELQAAFEAVGIDDVIDRLGGLDAPVHERGASLSAGERQLLALARAFVARPRVLILDEATSNLDLHSETRVEAALDIVLEGRTAVIIAHRLATARRADRIAVVDDGRIVELGARRVGGAGRSVRGDVRNVGAARRRSVSGDAACLVVRDRSQRGASIGAAGVLGWRAAITTPRSSTTRWTTGSATSLAMPRPENGESSSAGEGEGDPGARRVLDRRWDQARRAGRPRGEAGVHLDDPYLVFTDRSRYLGCGELGRGENSEVGELVVEAPVAAHDNSEVGCTSGDAGGEGEFEVGFVLADIGCFDRCAADRCIDRGGRAESRSPITRSGTQPSGRARRGTHYRRRSPRR